MEESFVSVASLRHVVSWLFVALCGVWVLAGLYTPSENTGLKTCIEHV